MEDDKNGLKYIETIPRRGYRFVADVTAVGAETDDLIVAEHTHSRITIEQSETAASTTGASGLEQASGAEALEKGVNPAAGITRRLAFFALSCGALALAIYYGITNNATRKQAAASVKSIAVLPFKPLISEQRDEYIELGMADALITKLSNLKQIIVRPTSAVLKYSALNQDPLAAGREQGVDALLEGRVQRLGDKLRVTVQLVRVSDGTPLWAYKCEEQCQDIFAAQDAISENVAKALALELSGEEGKRLAKHYTEDKEAYQLYLKGLYFWNKFEANELKKAIIYFQQATEKDPNYALAYSGLAHSYNVLGFNFLPPGEAFPQAKVAAAKALALDDTIAEAHAALGAIHLLYDFDWLAAEHELRRALELNPNYSTAHELYGYYLIAIGRIEDGLLQSKRAQELDPLSLVINDDIAAGYYYARRYDQAIEQVRKTLELAPNFSGARFWLGQAFAQKGRAEEAIAELKQAIAYSDEAQNIAMLGQIYAQLGMRSEAQQVITELTLQAKRRFVSPADMARIYAALGEKDQAFSWLAKAYEERSGWLIYIKVEPIFDSLRSDQRFTNLIRLMKYPPS